MQKSESLLPELLLKSPKIMGFEQKNLVFQKRSLFSNIFFKKTIKLPLYSSLTISLIKYKDLLLQYPML